MNANATSIYIILVLFQTVLVYCIQDFEAQEGKFPDIFYMDDYDKCSKENADAYCTANMNLIPNDVNSKFWRKIQDWSVPWYHYNHSVLHRTFCIPGQYEDYSAKKSYVERRTNEELKVYNVSAKIFSIDCKEDARFGVDIRVVLLVLSIYMGLIVMATIYDQTCHIKNGQSNMGKCMKCFSLTSNWQKLTSDKNPDFQRLKCVQGIRTYQTIVIIACHVTMSAIQLYIKNTSYIEKLFSNPFFLYSNISFMYVIQTYFVISSWLLTNKILGIYERNGKFSVKDGLIIFLQRVTRFWPPLLVMIFISGPIYVNFANGPGNFETANLIARTCKKNWWATFFFITNFLDASEVCNISMWSLSLDTQYYLINVVFLYVALNYKMNVKKCLALFFMVTYIVNVIIIYHRELPVLVWCDIERSKIINFFHDKALKINYFGFWINAGSSLVGVLFGYFYFHYKTKSNTEALEKLCGPIFAIVPIFAILLGSLDTGKFVSALIGPLLKPLFGFGIACGIYGISRNIVRGWSKSICENKYAVLLGNFTFATYIFHFFLVFSRGAKSNSLSEVVVSEFLVSWLIDIVKSFAVGIFCAVAIEQPGVNIQKMILPAIIRKDIEYINACNDKDK